MNIQFEQIELRLTHPWGTARSRGARTSTSVIVRLVDADGIIGFGEAPPIGRYNESVESVETFFRRIDPKRLSFSDIPASLHYLEALGSGNMAAKCAIDVALWDGAGKRAKTSVDQLLGHPFREGQHTTSFTIGIDSPEAIQSKVIAAQSFPVLKMKVGVAGDVVNLRAVREAAPRKRIRLDANEGWTSKEQALRTIEFLATADSEIEFVEQPLSAETPLADWKWLKDRSPLPIFADESYHCADDAPEAAECFHGVNVKLSKAGGISGSFAALKAARKHELKTMLGCMIETSVLITAAAHLAELCDHLDLDGNLLVSNDPFTGVVVKDGILSFANAPERFGLRVAKRLTDQAQNPV